jgi:NAD(P)-dependent dehydrogenase (short-subunit alcohol dehydrogenase family)
MKIQGATALVTGANRGLGRHIAQQLRDRGANVYAGARNPGSVNLRGVTPVQLDITDPASVNAAAATAKGVSILVNNAGIGAVGGLLTSDVGEIRRLFDTNFFGALAVTRAFAAQLGEHEESYILNVLSVASWLNSPWLGGYSASKSAAWSLTNGIRQELASQGTRVGALHVGLMDTDLAAGVDQPKADPADIARITVDGIAEGAVEILADEASVNVRAGLPLGEC